MHNISEKLAAFEKLLNIMDQLRNNCPWDKKQTFESLRNLTIEETYELADAIIEKDHKGMREELGDMLLHIVFYAKIGSETNSFDIKDITDSIIEKLIHRHPHIFGDVQVSDAEEVKRNWEQLKRQEGKASLLAGVPAALPSIVKAKRIQEKARGVGFDWEVREQVWDKVDEEINELKVEITHNDKDSMEAEFGDVLFSIINAARLYDIDPDNALERTNKKFIKRFNYLEQETIMKGKSLHDMSLEEMNKIWEKAKTI